MPKVYVAELVNEGAALAPFFTDRYGSLGDVTPLVNNWRGGTPQDIVDAVIETMRDVGPEDCIAQAGNNLIFAVAAGEMAAYFDTVRVARYELSTASITVDELTWDMSSFGEPVVERGDSNPVVGYLA